MNEWVGVVGRKQGIVRMLGKVHNAEHLEVLGLVNDQSHCNQ